MSQFATATSSYTRIAIAVFAVLLIVLLSACDDFYSDSPPTPDIAQPTPANVQEGNPEQNVEIAARDAMAAKLGIATNAPRKILLEHAKTRASTQLLNSYWVKALTSYPGTDC